MDYLELLEIKNKKKKEEFEKLKKTVKPCPLCGKPVKMFSIGYGSGNYGSGSHIVIVCDNCNLEVIGPDTSWTYEYDHNDEVKEFIKKWNTRVEVE